MSTLERLSRPVAPSFFGAPWFHDGGAARIAIGGVPYDLGNSIAPGAREAPRRIRLASIGLARNLDLGVTDVGDLHGARGEEAATILEHLGDAVEGLIERSLFPLLVGGDHSISFSAVERLQRERDVSVIWLDAHTDFNIWSGRGAHDHKEVLRRIADLPRVRRIVQVGHRGYTPKNELCLGEAVRVLRPADLRTGGVAALLAELPRDLPCYLSLDIDALDPAYAPGTSTPVPGGFKPEEVELLIAAVFRRREVLGMDLVEVNPLLDVAARTALLAGRLLLAAIFACRARA